MGKLQYYRKISIYPCGKIIHKWRCSWKSSFHKRTLTHARKKVSSAQIYSLCRTWARNHVWFPRCYGHGMFVCCIATPQTLYEQRCWYPASDEVFLSLLLLYFQSEPGTKNTLKYTINQNKDMTPRTTPLDLTQSSLGEQTNNAVIHK